jgi:hypothetical protein
MAVALSVTMTTTVPQATAAADDTPTQLLSATITPLGGSTDSGWLPLRLDLELSDPEGLDEGPDDYLMGNFGWAVSAQARSLDDSAVIGVDWIGFRRMSGTSTHGIWSCTEVVTRFWAGTYQLSSIRPVMDNSANETSFTLDDGPVFAVTASGGWTITPITSVVRIVTGNEPWRPTLKVTDRNTGLPVSAWITTGEASDYIDWGVPTRAYSEPGSRIPATGVWVGPLQVSLTAYWFVMAWGSRASRGWSLEAWQFAICPAAKIQASSRYSATVLPRSGTLTVSGHGFPAPAVYTVYYPEPMPVYLQRLEGATWRTIATSHVRSNGRFDLTWHPDTTGVHQLRTRIPGTVNQCGTHVGTASAAIPVTVTS